MVFCRNCGAKLDSGTKYCTYCGSPIPESDRANEGASVQNGQQSSYAPPVNEQPTQYYYSSPPPAPKKKSGKVIGIIVAVVVIGIIIIGAIIVIGAFSDNNVRPTIEYDSGFESVTCVQQGDYWVYTPVMKKGYIFDHWVLPNGDVCKDKVITMSSGSGTLKGYSTAGYTVTVYSMFGISIEYNGKGNGDYTTYQSATVEATNEMNKFLGWYSADGILLSSNKTYDVPEKSDVTIIAKSDSDRYAGTSTLNADLTGSGIVPSTSKWYVLDGKILVGTTTGVSNINVSVNPGIYNVVIVGKNSAGSDETLNLEKEVKGTYTMNYSWKYEMTDYSFTWTVSYDTYKALKESDTDRMPESDSDMSAFVTTDLPDSVVVDKLNTMTSTMTELQRANFVLKFVQRCTCYQTDMEYNGMTEYWKYPLETLVDQRGDCEDTAILYCNLMRAMGHYTALLLYEAPYYTDGHAAAGVNISTYVPGGSSYEVDSIKYYYCETTSDTMIVGEPWTEYSDHCHVVPISKKT